MKTPQQTIEDLEEEVRQLREVNSKLSEQLDDNRIHIENLKSDIKELRLEIKELDRGLRWS